jgi:hypothetical protein
MYYAVLDLDAVRVVTIEPELRSAEEMVDALRSPKYPHLCEGVRNTLIVEVEADLWVAWSHGVTLELVFDGQQSQVVPVVRIRH